MARLNQARLNDIEQQVATRISELFKRTANMEQQLVVRIDDREQQLAARIDELYWEHHVLRHPMAYTLGGWGLGKARRAMNETIEESYRTFARLRELGIRAHSWV